MCDYWPWRSRSLLQVVLEGLRQFGDAVVNSFVTWWEHTLCLSGCVIAKSSAFSEALSGLCFVTCSICDFHGQNFKGHLRNEECSVLVTSGYSIFTLGTWGRIVGKLQHQILGDMNMSGRELKSFYYPKETRVNTECYCITKAIGTPLVKLVHSVEINWYVQAGCMCACEFATKMTEAESVSATIYESSNPISQLPTRRPPTSHQADPIFTLLMTQCLC